MPELPVLAALRKQLGEKLITDPLLRAGKARDRSYHHGEAPLAVVQPKTTNDVALAMAICSEHRTAVVPRGSGTGLEGGANTTANSVCLDLSSMDKVMEIAVDDMFARVQPGVMKSALNAALAKHQLAFPVGPGVDASLGGMASTSASGTTAVSYGTLKENVLGLTAVLADGTVFSTGGVTRKTSSGYDLTHLLVGSEGTLGVITELVVKVHPVPEAAEVTVWSLPTLHAASNLVVAALRSSLRLARVELLDDITVDAIARYNGLRLPVSHTLMVEFEGSANDVAARTSQFSRLAAEFGAELAASASKPQDTARLWQARHDALPASQALIPDSEVLTTDVCVPISQLPDCILQTKEDVASFGVLAPIVGHVGDGNFHLAMVLPPGDEDAFIAAKQLNTRLVARALAMGGTCTGEHGIGEGKIDSMSQEHASAVPVMQALKTALDPHGILNPGKVLPPG